jgi:hypothetical protein
MHLGYEVPPLQHSVIGEPDWTIPVDFSRPVQGEIFELSNQYYLQRMRYTKAGPIPDGPPLPIHYGRTSDNRPIYACPHSVPPPVDRFLSVLRSRPVQHRIRVAPEEPAPGAVRAPRPRPRRPARTLPLGTRIPRLLQTPSRAAAPPAPELEPSESDSQRIAPRRKSGEKQRNPKQQQPRDSETMEQPPRSADATSTPAPPSGAHPVAQQQPTPSPVGDPPRCAAAHP